MCEKRVLFISMDMCLLHLMRNELQQRDSRYDFVEPSVRVVLVMTVFLVEVVSLASLVMSAMDCHSKNLAGMRIRHHLPCVAVSLILECSFVPPCNASGINHALSLVFHKGQFCKRGFHNMAVECWAALKLNDQARIELEQQFVDSATAQQDGE